MSLNFYRSGPTNGILYSGHLLCDHARFAAWEEPTVALGELDVLLARTGIHTCLFWRDVSAETLLLHWRCFD